MPDLSDSLTDKIQQETYGLFPIPVTKVSLPNHDQYKQQILTWMAQQSILEKHSREAICYNVSQIGETNQLLLDLPDLAQDILNAAITHNNNANKYNTNLAISESYLELHHEGAIYAPHEHSNCLFSLTYFINYNSEQHSYLKFRRNVASNHYPIIQLDATELSPFNMTEATFNMAEGDVVVYPANMTHGYDNNPSNERITLTANIVPQ
jgi:hypothetical protein